MQVVHNREMDARDENEIPVGTQLSQFKKRSKRIILLGILLFAVFSLVSICTLLQKTDRNQNESAPYSPHGTIVIPIQFDSLGIGIFIDGMASYSLKPDYNTLLRRGAARKAFVKLLSDHTPGGYVSKKGMIIPPKFQYTDSFNNGYAVASIDGKTYGLLNKNGSWIIPPAYKYMHRYGDGLIPVLLGKKYGYINLEGQVILSPKWDSAFSFTSHRAEVCQFGGESSNNNIKCGFIDTSGKTVVPMEYDYVEDYSDGYSLVCKGLDSKQLCGYINHSGKIVYPIIIPAHSQDGFWFPGASSFSASVALIGGGYFGNIEKWGFVDKKFHYVIPISINQENCGGQRFDEPWSFDTDLQWETVGTSPSSIGKCAAMDKRGNIKFFSTYQETQPFSQGVSAVKIDGKWGFINEQNQLVVQPMYQEVALYSEGLAAVKLDGKWGFID